MLAELAHKAPRSANTRLNLILVRLACCCGLRVSEIAKRQIEDVRSEVSRPHLRIRRGAAKGGRPRMAPLWWDAGTLADLAQWKKERQEHGAGPQDQFVASLRSGRAEVTFSRHTLRNRFRTACKVLGPFAGKRTLAEVRDAAGHANASITSGYLHVAVEDDGVGNLFSFLERTKVEE